MTTQNASPVCKEKVMSYEEKSVGSTQFFQCEACPYMALAEDDIKFHLFTVHPDLAKSNGLADNIQIPCPGCTSIFAAEGTLRTHLRNHHKMGIKDVKKMVKSLIQIALKNAKLKKEVTNTEPPPPAPPESIPDVKIPQVIEIVHRNSDTNVNHESLPKGVTFISMDELYEMSTPNFEKVDPKEIIQEASINIVYTNEVSTQYVNVSEAGTSNTNCNMQMSSVPPDLISSIQPKVSHIDNQTCPTSKDNSYTSQQHKPEVPTHSLPQIEDNISKSETEDEIEKTKGKLCPMRGCNIRLKDETKLTYHIGCHHDNRLKCLECNKICLSTEALHTHLWKIHAIDMELPTCEICGFKTYKKYRLYNIHMKCHGEIKAYFCPLCPKSFKNANQLSKHKLIHKREIAPVQCALCQMEFSSERRMKIHAATVHVKLKPFKCNHCDYTAARKAELKLHLRSQHTGDKPYSCNQCSYKSADHNSMRRHKKTHSNESVYKCKYCPYSAIQSALFASHMLSKHPNESGDVHRCPYCPFRSINKSKYLIHLTNHTDKEGVQLLIEMTKNVNTNKPSWTIPSETVEKSIDEDTKISNEPTPDPSPKTVNSMPIVVYDCDSLCEPLPQNYSKNYCTTASNEVPQPDYNRPVVTDLSKDDNNSDCLISESSNDTMERHQYVQHPLELAYDNTQSNLHFLSPVVSMEQNLLQNNNVNSLANHSAINNTITNNIMSNFPIRLPPTPQISVRNNIMLQPVGKISLPVTKVTGPIIKPTQILPVPSSSNSPVNMSTELEGAPRKKPKISVKSNLILKGPDEENMFHSQQKMAFKRLEDNERFGLGGPVTFNNLITTQFMQLQPEPTLSESPNNIMPYPQENMMGTPTTTPVGNDMDNNSQIFKFNQQLNVNTLTMPSPPPQKIQTNDPSYIKIEATIKQNTQSPSLERMCNANLLNTQAISREYKASPPLEDIHKNMNDIKNEVKSDTYYNLALNNSTANPSMIDQYLIDNLMGEQYTGHMELSPVVLPEISEEQQNDVIEIDDNSDDNKLLPCFEMNFPLEPVYMMHNEFFLENDIPSNNMANEVNEMNRMVNEVPIMNQKENLEIVHNEVPNNDFPNFIQGKKDPMMNTSVRPTTNKINVKNIELMKN